MGQHKSLLLKKRKKNGSKDPQRDPCGCAQVAKGWVGKLAFLSSIPKRPSKGE